MPSELSRREQLVLALFCLALVLAVTWPMPLHPIDTVVGHEKATVRCHVWLLWWARTGLDNPQVASIFFPYGADVVQLYGSDIVSPLLLRLSHLPLGLAYNLWVGFLLFAGGFGTAWLCRQLGASMGGALVGATVFQAAPFLQHELLNGTSELLAASCLPWIAGGLIRLMERPSAALGIKLGTLAGLAACTSAYNAFFIAAVTLSIVCHRLTMQKKPLFTRVFVRSSGLGVFVTSLFAMLLLLLHRAHGGSGTMERRSQWWGLDLPDASADLLAFFDPTPAQIPLDIVMADGRPFSYWTTCTVYIGFVALGLAGVALWKRRSREYSPLGAFGLMACIGLLLSLGPFLRVGGSNVELFGHLLPLPVLTIAELFPPFAVTAVHSYRYAVVVVLAIAVLAGCGVGARKRVAGIALGAVLLESFVLAPPPTPAAVTPMPSSRVLEELAERPDAGVFTLPCRRDDLGDLGLILLAQTVHGKPVHDGGIQHRAGAQATRLVRENRLVASVSERFGATWPAADVARAGLDDLREKGYAYVLVSLEEGEWLASVVSTLGEPVDSDEEWALWLL